MKYSQLEQLFNNNILKVDYIITDKAEVWLDYISTDNAEVEGYNARKR